MDSEELTQGQSDTKTEENVGFFNIAQICEIFSISRQTVYSRMNYLQIKPYKKGNSRYLDTQQMAHLQGLDNYYKEHNCFEGYPVPEKSGPWEQTADAPTSSAGIEQAITPFQSVGMGQHSIPLETEFVTTASRTESELENIDKQAQILAASRYIATQNLANYYANTGQFTIPEIAQMVQQRRGQTQAEWELSHANSDPNYLTQLLINRAKAKTAAG